MKRDQAKMRAVPLGACQYCGIAEARHRHHIVPRSITQCDDPENLIALCPTCHSNVHAKSIDLGICLTASQGAKAVLLCGTLYRAFMLLYPSEKRRVASHLGEAA